MTTAQPPRQKSKNMSALKLLAIVKKFNSSESFLDGIDWPAMPEYRKIRMQEHSDGETLIEFGAGKTLLAGLVNVDFLTLATYISTHRNDKDVDGCQAYLMPTSNREGVLFKTICP